MGQLLGLVNIQQQMRSVLLQFIAERRNEMRDCSFVSGNWIKASEVDYYGFYEFGACTGFKVENFLFAR